MKSNAQRERIDQTILAVCPVCNYERQISSECHQLPQDGRGRFVRKCRSCSKKGRKTHCNRGHELSPDNVLTFSNGDRHCKICRKTSNKIWRKSPKGVEIRRKAHRQWRLRKSYGLTIDGFNALLKKQGGCAICRCTTPTGFGVGAGNGWHVDHNHHTNKTRGILCARCNLLIGMLNEDPSFINQILEYLKAHE